jgi:hypothetical protein
MTRTKSLASVLLIVIVSLPLRAAEALEGRWLLVSQEIGGKKIDVDQLTLRIVPIGRTLEFAYSVPVNNVQFVSLRFTAMPDGTEADVTNASGKKIGTVRVTRVGASLYKMVLQGQNKPTATGTITISTDGKTLTSESESKQPGQVAMTRMIQVFSRQ